MVTTASFVATADAAAAVRTENTGSAGNAGCRAVTCDDAHVQRRVVENANSYGGVNLLGSGTTIRHATETTS